MKSEASRRHNNRPGQRILKGQGARIASLPEVPLPLFGVLFMFRAVIASSLMLALLLLAPLAHAGDKEKKADGDKPAAKANKDDAAKATKENKAKADAKAKADKKPGEKQPKAEKQPRADKAAKAKKPMGAAGVVKSLDATTKSITITHANKKAGTSEDKIFTIADDAKISVKGQPATLADVPVGKRAKLTLSDDGQKVVAITVGSGNKKPKEKKPAV
jgi:Cu/Ag efflux protein CusF